jgi:hypothetical protein
VRGYTLAKPVSIQDSAKAARELNPPSFWVWGQSATIGFVRKSEEVWFRDDQAYRSGELSIEPLCQVIMARASQLAGAIASKVTGIRYLRSQGQDPRLLVSLEPVG